MAKIKYVFYNHGTLGDDIITGTWFDDLILGKAGNDWIAG